MRRRSSGFTLLEMFVALTIFGGIMVITTMLLRQSVWIWTSGDSRESAALVLRKARTNLMRDLARADVDTGPDGELHMDQMKVPETLGGSDALWFLSAEGADGVFQRDNDGYPFWQQNILYYLAKPANHDELYGMSCAAGSNPLGDDFCPHKALIKVVIDNPPETDPLPPPGNPPPPSATPETLLTASEASAYIMAPTGNDVSALQSVNGVKEARVITTGVLWFKVTTAPGAVDSGRQIDLRAVAVKEASKQVSVGNVSLLNQPATLKNIFSVFPNN